MSARRTPWWRFAVAVVLGLAAGAALVKITERSDFTVMGAPWIVPILLAVVGVVVFAMAWQVRQYVSGKRKYLNPAVSVYALVLSKALGLVAAALFGWYVGQILAALGHADAPFYAQAMVECGVSAVVCLADMVVGIVGERFCQLPPGEGPENPKIKAAERRRNLAAASSAESAASKASAAGTAASATSEVASR
ncbi:hypothetical protein G1C96_0666 [Bifidobacterium sp. DSM 109958]|uniref:DUF3180 domain-containing protein n=1 Tax=Bifidobacterium moraviense TaxID=2675323 RepID=A0A7Y0F142_9BIFI|nr:DUF3180 domain-containing protein [Bifidobacterium sp. DSM 109958]NMN00089.1 hypothetical protein [Bifidobacterium sp. DSM 109958]